MNETLLVWLVPLRLLAVMLFTFCYVLGGRAHKWIRRFVGPAIFTCLLWVIAVLLHSSLWKLSPLLGLPIVLSLPYTNKDGYGWLRRLVYGVLFGAIGLAVSILAGCWPVGMLQGILCVLASMVLGMLNPVEAVNEEALIATLSVVLIPFMI